MKYKHISYEERVKIEGYLAASKSYHEIARLLDRSRNTISYEIQKNSVKGIYSAKKAQVKAYQKRYWSKKECLKVSMNNELQRFIEACLEKHWSPERISGYMKRIGITCSTKAIYKYIQQRSLERYLFWSWNKRKPGMKRYHNGRTNDGRRYIDQRILSNESGHYEADFIVSSKSSYVLLVVVDIHTRFVTIKRLTNRKHAVVQRAFKTVFKGKKVKSLTLDNDIAFNCWRKVASDSNTTIYFTHPYSSWEKGLVENMNRWIRCFVAKRKDIGTVSVQELKNIQDWMNDTPRQCLGFRSSNEVVLEH
jgi:IS30 family transposase